MDGVARRKGAGLEKAPAGAAIAQLDNAIGFLKTGITGIGVGPHDFSNDKKHGQLEISLLQARAFRFRCNVRVSAHGSDRA